MRFFLLTLLIVVTTVALLALVISIAPNSAPTILFLTAYSLWIVSVAAALATKGGTRCFWATFAIVFALYPILDIGGGKVSNVIANLFFRLPEKGKVLDYVRAYHGLIVQPIMAFVGGTIAGLIYHRCNRIDSRKDSST